MFAALTCIIAVGVLHSPAVDGQEAADSAAHGVSAEGLAMEGERHLRNVRQLTFGGENAEAYFSFDGQRLVFQASPPGVGCD